MILHFEEKCTYPEMKIFTHRCAKRSEHPGTSALDRQGLCP